MMSKSKKSCTTKQLCCILLMQTLALSNAFVQPSPGGSTATKNIGRTFVPNIGKSIIIQDTTTTVGKITSAAPTSSALNMAPVASLVSNIASPLASVAVLASVILIHEGGHYLAARSLNITVEEFSVGIGPKLFGFTTKQNEFNLRAVPLGGYVRFPENYNMTQARIMEEAAFVAEMERKEKLQANINMTLATKTLDVLTFGAISRSKENQEEERLRKLQEEQEQNQSWFQKTFSNKKKSDDMTSAVITKQEDVEIEYYDDPDLLQNRPWIQKAVVLLGGIIFNILLAFACYFGEITVGDGLQKPVFDQGAIIRSINSPAAASAGLLKPGDVILGVNGLPLSTTDPDGVSSAQRSISNLVSTIRSTPTGESVELLVRHPSTTTTASGKTETLTIQPKRSLDPNTGREGPQSIGVMLGPNYVRTEVVHAKNLGEAASLASQAVGDLTSETVRSLFNLFSQIGSKGGVTSQMTGPIGLINTGSEVVKTNDSGALIAFVAAVSINLAVINSVPLPALDGGQLVFVIAEAITGRKVNQKFQEGITAATVVFLLIVSFSTAVEDVFNIFGK